MWSLKRMMRISRLTTKYYEEDEDVKKSDKSSHLDGSDFRHILCERTSWKQLH